MIFYQQSVFNVGVSKSNIIKAVEIILKRLGKDEADVSIHLVGYHKIKKLNHTYRGINRATDVITFAAQDSVLPVFKNSVKNDLGDIFLCPEYIRAQASRFSVTYKEEFFRMLTHGILHSDGYDHMKEADAKKMFSLQESIVKEIYG